MNLSSRVGEEVVTVRLNEVEAYGDNDPASHSFCGPTDRNRTMFGPAGRLYVYLSYGIHWCANVVTGKQGSGQAVLFRGGEVLQGREIAERRRGRSAPLADGPGKLAQALGLSREHDGTDLTQPNSPIWLEPNTGPVPFRTTPRIGISTATDRPWRFVSLTS